MLTEPSRAVIRKTSLVVWAALILSWFLAIRRYAHQFPRSDEENFTEIVTGLSRDWWSFIWTAGNEHYSPLIRLYYVLVDRWTSWNIPVVLYIQLALIAIAALVWIRRSCEGSWMEPAMLYAVLSPAAFETWLSACSYAPLFPVFLFLSTAYLNRQWEQSWFGCFSFFFLMGVCLFCGFLVGGMLQMGFWLAVIFLSFKYRRNANRKGSVAAIGCVLLGLILVLAVRFIPAAGHHAHFKAANLGQLLQAVYLNLQFGLLGYFPRAIADLLFPILLVGLVPLFPRAVKPWSDRKTMLLLASLGSLGLLIAVSYARANYGSYISRYFVMVSPFWVFFLLALQSKTTYYRNYSFGLFLLMTLGAISSSERLLEYAREIREKDRIIVGEVLNNSPEEAAQRTIGVWGDTPDRLVQVIRALQQAKQSVFSQP